MGENICEANVYALREFLDRYARESDGMFMPSGCPSLQDLLGRERYVFSIVEKSPLGTLSFKLKGGNLFRKHPVVLFGMYGQSGMVEVRRGVIAGEEDERRVKALVDLLEETPYSRLIANLDVLK